MPWPANQWWMLPVLTAGYFFEALSRAALELERQSPSPWSPRLASNHRQDLPNIFRPLSTNPEPPTAHVSISEFPKPGDSASPEPHGPTLGTSPTEPRQWTEERSMADTNLNDDMVKLIQYSIVSIKRREERIIAEAIGEDGELGRPLLYLETDNITGDGFSNARIADWMKTHCNDKAKDVDPDSLRVYYDVVARWPRSTLKFEEERLDQEDEKIDLLRKIANPNS